jgi:pyrimidine operon attenuation protein/uracil phosphoribosyltransferase
MVVKMINHSADKLTYPVGDYIGNNIKLINLMVKSFIELEKFHKRHINIICRGSSGAIIASFFANAIAESGKYGEFKIIHIKKEGEASHTHGVPKLLKGRAINVIVDDFTCSGKTIRTIYEMLNKGRKTKLKIHGLCLSGYAFSTLDDINFVPEYFFTK